MTGGVNLILRREVGACRSRNPEAQMRGMDEVFAEFPKAEMIPTMKRAFDETAAAIDAWGETDGVFDDDEAEDMIAAEISTLAHQGVADINALRSAALLKYGAAALNRLAQDAIRPPSTRAQ
jgi:hypothetical protein